jgi:hypothetical protein
MVVGSLIVIADLPSLQRVLFEALKCDLDLEKLLKDFLDAHENITHLKMVSDVATTRPIDLVHFLCLCVTHSALLGVGHGDGVSPRLVIVARHGGSPLPSRRDGVLPLVI